MGLIKKLKKTTEITVINVPADQKIVLLRKNYW